MPAAKRPASKPAPARTCTVTVLSEGGTTMTALPVPFDPKEVFGMARPAVVVRVGRTSFRSTIFNMGGERFVPLRRSNREAAGVAAGQRVRVTFSLDTEPRVVKAPRDLLAALKAAGLTDAWKSLSFTHQREHVEAIEEAKKPETRERRIVGCVAMVRERAAKAPRTSRAAPRT